MTAGLIAQAGAICFVKDQLVLVTNKSRTRWVIPKGHVERHDSTEAFRAVTEAWEEAGVRFEGEPTECGSFFYTKGGGLYRVAVFRLNGCELAAQWPEQSVRQRRLMSVRQASELVQEPELKQILLSLPRTFDPGAGL